MDPETLLSQDREGYLVQKAILEKSLQIEGQEESDKMKVLAQMIGVETAKIIAKMFS
ncbi:hypothetical protein KGP36_08325 [Patescibacteria group bacterium]|nr:hypothetical protein [Patescibacteria group bacterium]